MKAQRRGARSGNPLLQTWGQLGAFSFSAWWILPPELHTPQNPLCTSTLLSLSVKKMFFDVSFITIQLFFFLRQYSYLVLKKQKKDFTIKIRCLLLKQPRAFLVSYRSFQRYYMDILMLFSHSVVSDFCDPMDCSLPGSSVHGASQVRIW